MLCGLISKSFSPQHGVLVSSKYTCLNSSTSVYFFINGWLLDLIKFPKSITFVVPSLKPTFSWWPFRCLIVSIFIAQLFSDFFKFWTYFKDKILIPSVDNFQIVNRNEFFKSFHFCRWKFPFFDFVGGSVKPTFFEKERYFDFCILINGMNMNRVMLIGIKPYDYSEIFKNFRHNKLITCYNTCYKKWVVAAYFEPIGFGFRFGAGGQVRSSLLTHFS